MKPCPDNTRRFTHKADDYDRNRPDYSPDFLAWLRLDRGFGTDTRVADIGAGTGILTRQLWECGATVFAVEPNAAMRERGQSRLGVFPRIRWIDATAEHTTLDDHSVDWVIAGQAFHWFETSAFRAEVRRITGDPNRAILLWNRHVPGQPGLEALDALNRESCPDYRGESGGLEELRHRIDAFFEDGWAVKTFPHDQSLDRDTFVFRALSRSYAPDRDCPAYASYCQRLDALFTRFAPDGRLLVRNQTVAYLARSLAG